jgi:uncharacterized FAD-dependent dehydrogenase
MQRVAIIGGGPAGLATGQVLAEAGIDFVLFEAGKALLERQHEQAGHLGAGIGGAGLFSDGKFSFYPSGTHLYTLADRLRLEEAYGSIERQLTEAGIEAPPLSPDAGDGFVAADAPMIAKTYPSTYGSLIQRRALIGRMIRDFEEQIRCETRVEHIDETADGFSLRSVGTDGNIRDEQFSHLALATGRFGPQALAGMLSSPMAMTDLRLEFGIRLEHPDGVGFLSRVKRPDVKFILDALETEVRTFCTCRNGEVWMIPYGDVAALSGRSDGPPSRYCNFGLLARFTGQRFETGRRIWDAMQKELGEEAPAVWQPLPEFLGQRMPDGDPDPHGRPWYPQGGFRRGDIAGKLHPELYEILAESLRMLIGCFPDMLSPETVCLFPAIEGVGAFPAVDNGLSAGDGRIWFCGDVVGRFRGLVPALVSGAYAGAAIAAALGHEVLPSAEEQWRPVAAQ